MVARPPLPVGAPLPSSDAELAMRLQLEEAGAGTLDAGEVGAAPEPPTAYKVTCPLCRKKTCVRCRCLWHKYMTCAAYQAERESTDALRVLAKQRKWKACPGCGELIDKEAGDCNFVRHRACGTGFCFSCGLAYASLKPTPENEHGRAACQCGLWRYTDSEGDDDDDVSSSDSDYDSYSDTDSSDSGAGAGAEADPPGERGAQDDAVGYNFIGLVEAALKAPPPQLEDGGGTPVVHVARNEETLDLRLLLRQVDYGRRLPNGLVRDLRNSRCSYPSCNREFVSLGALQDHLSNTLSHSVLLCCNRPFLTAASLDQHLRNSTARPHRYCRFLVDT